MDPLDDLPDERLEIKNRSDLIDYLNHLAERTELHPEEVENPTSAALIEAAAAWLNDTRDRLPLRDVRLDDLNPWQMMAIVFSAALIYE